MKPQETLQNYDHKQVPEVLVKDQQVITTSLQVANFFSKDHSHVLRDIQQLACDDDFRQSNFGQSSYLNAQNKIMPMFEMTRDGFTILVMGYTGKDAMKYKVAYIKAFNLMEQELKKLSIPQDLPTALRLAADEHEKRIEAEKQLAIAAPKVHAYDEFLSADGTVSLSDVAKILNIKGVGRNNFIQMLRRDKIFTAGKGSTEPYQDYIAAGYFVRKIKSIKYGDENIPVTRVTAKGVDWLVKRYKGGKK